MNFIRCEECEAGSQDPQKWPIQHKQGCTKSPEAPASARTLRARVESAIKEFGAEGGEDPLDFILACYLKSRLAAFDAAIGGSPRPAADTGTRTEVPPPVANLKIEDEQAAMHGARWRQGLAGNSAMPGGPISEERRDQLSALSIEHEKDLDFGRVVLEVMGTAGFRP